MKEMGGGRLRSTEIPTVFWPFLDAQKLAETGNSTKHISTIRFDLFIFVVLALVVCSVFISPSQNCHRLTKDFGDF